MSGGSIAITKRKQADRDRVFKKAEGRVWDRRSEKGFTTMPRAIPLVCAIIDALSKGQPLSSVYLDLWFKVYDEMYLIIESPTERAFYAGFGGQRAETTWTTRMRKLAELGFIEVAPGTRGEFHHVLVVNPYLAIDKIEKTPAKVKLIGTQLLDAYHQRLREVGAKP
jgi:hypothetical protein